ncbi:hypothetical protein [Nocardia africana]
MNYDNMSNEELDATVEAAKQILERRQQARTEAKESQPERLGAMQVRADIARRAAIAEEPWDTLWSALPGFTADGELAAMLALPSIDAKELFGARLAFDLASHAGDEDAIDEITNWYFTEVRSPEHMFLIAMAALKVLTTGVLEPLLQVAEEGAQRWDFRVMLADAARNAWEQRINSDAA